MRPICQVPGRLVASATSRNGARIVRHAERLGHASPSRAFFSRQVSWTKGSVTP